MPSFRTLNHWLGDGLNIKKIAPTYLKCNLSRVAKAIQFFFGYDLKNTPMACLYKMLEGYEANHQVNKKSEVDLDAINVFLSQPGIRDGTDRYIDFYCKLRTFFDHFSYFRYLLVRAALGIMAFCSSSRPAELSDVTFSQVTRDEKDRGIWFRKIHAKNKKGT